MWSQICYLQFQKYTTIQNYLIIDYWIKLSYNLNQYLTPFTNSVFFGKYTEICLVFPLGFIYFIYMFHTKKPFSIYLANSMVTLLLIVIQFKEFNLILRTSWHGHTGCESPLYELRTNRQFSSVGDSNLALHTKLANAWCVCCLKWSVYLKWVYC